jgi:hypothetical protein
MHLFFTFKIKSMKFSFQIIALVVMVFVCRIATAQGPPITGDKPIMLAPGNMVFKTLTEIRQTERGTYIRAPFTVNYIVASNTLISASIPYVSSDNLDGTENLSGLGDIQLLGKYQFFRKDQMGKTFRVVAKGVQTFPTGEKINIHGISQGKYQSYIGSVAGYETIKYGISNEIGYNFIPDGEFDEFRYKLGFGLPLLKPKYPVDQINLYFEYQNSWYPERDEYELLYSQGIQYAKGQFTLEATIQFPLIQANVLLLNQRKRSIFLGMRYVI